MPTAHAQNLLARVVTGLVVTGFASCGSTPKEPESEPFVAPVPTPPDATGFLLVKLDNEVRAWQNLKHTGSSPKDQRMLRSLERQLAQDTGLRRDDLLAELESQSRKNRAIAAVALGFTGDPEVVGPLYSALGDPDATVAHNALLGLAILADASTPLGRICFLLSTSEDGFTRVNAAYALSAITGAGGRDPEVEPVCIAALDDKMGGVRAQAASVLGRLSSTAAITSLGDLLYDEDPLVTRAAATALAAIALEHRTELGAIARLMVGAAARRKPTAKVVILLETRRLSSTDWGDDIDLWVEWAHRLP
jgi:HEAT repeat protein